MASSAATTWSYFDPTSLEPGRRGTVACGEDERAQREADTNQGQDSEVSYIAAPLSAMFACLGTPQMRVA